MRDGVQKLTKGGEVTAHDHENGAGPLTAPFATKNFTDFFDCLFAKGDPIMNNGASEQWFNQGNTAQINCPSGMAVTLSVRHIASCYARLSLSSASKAVVHLSIIGHKINILTENLIEFDALPDCTVSQDGHLLFTVSDIGN